MRTHKTKEGKVMFVSEMTSKHILSTIRACVERVTKMQEAASVDRFQALVHGLNVNEETIVNAVQSTHEFIMPYVTELVLRGDHVDEAAASLRVLLRRDGPVVGLGSGSKALPRPDNPVDWDHEDDRGEFEFMGGDLY